MKHTFGWLALAVVVGSALVIGVVDRGGPRTPEERARSIGETISCPVCDGQSVADSDATPARSIRVFINEQIDAGRTDDEIRADVDRRFPESLLLTPQRSGVAAIVWVLPVVVLVLAVAGVGYAFVRWRDTPQGREASPADHALVDAALRSGDGDGGPAVAGPDDTTDEEV